MKSFSTRIWIVPAPEIAQKNSTLLYLLDLE